MSTLNVVLTVATFWCSMPHGLAAESTCAENDHACKADTKTGGVGMLQKKRSVESSTLEDNAKDADMEAAFARQKEQAMARDRARVKMSVEQDLSKLSDKHYRAWELSANCLENANAAFDQFISTSNLAEEMNASEITCFRTFFDEHVEAKCKSQAEMTEDYWRKLIGEAFEDEKPVLTEAMATAINLAHSGSFSVKVSKCMPMRELKVLEGHDTSEITKSAALLQHNSLHKEIQDPTPSTFDPLTTWPECSAVIDYRDHNQGSCGSCWAFAGTHALDGRVCIASGGRFQAKLSRTVLTSCGSTGDGCQGGWAHYVYDYIASNPVPTGGIDGCVPYFAHGEGIDHFHETQGEPACPTECLPHSGLDFAMDSVIAPGAQNGGVVFMSSAGPTEFTTLKNIIMQGPVSFGVYVNNEFYGYSSGVFDSGCGTQANHCVTGIGWGSAGGQEYFDTINSWGSSWGDNGAMKIAPCVVGDYEYPGSFSLPPSPPSTPTPPPTIPPPTPAPAFTIDGTGCAITEDGCVASAHYPADYDDSISCTIQNMATPFTVLDFNTEANFDFLYVGGVAFSGSGIPSELAAGDLAGNIEWSADYGIRASGWKICPPPTVTPTFAPSAPPTAYPTPKPAPEAPTFAPTATLAAYPTPKPAPEGQKTLFDLLDSNHDMVISKAEWVDAW